MLVASLIAFALMVVDFRYSTLQPFRYHAAMVAYPLQSLVDLPSRSFNQLGQFLTTHKLLVAQTQALQSERLYHLGKLQTLHALQAENKRLTALLQSATEAQESLLIANILHVDPDPFSHQVLVSKGKRDGVFKGEPIIDAKGVMGCVIAVYERTARVLLITDASHAIPVENLRNDARAIASGTGQADYLELRHVPNTVDLQRGDELVTSGLGGRYPAGYPVGVVSEVHRDPEQPFATVMVTPKARLDRSRQVLLVQIAKEPADAK